MRLASILFALVIAPACIGSGTEPEPPDTEDSDDGAMPCLAQVTDPVLAVNEYEWNGATYYYFTMDCCDQFNQVYDDQCNYVCAPDGGFAGTGDGQCLTFFDEAVAGSQVWP